MATVSGTFTAVGLSAVLDVTALGEDITISLTGGATATVELQREKVPYSGAWTPIRTYVGDVEASFRQERKNERYRFECTSYTAGTVTYSVSDGDKRIGTTLLDSEGNEIITYTQAGVDVSGALTVAGVLVATGGADTGTLSFNSGSITDSSGAISFGNENLSTTGTLASGALTVTGAISDTAASALTTGATIGTLTLADGSITDSGATISFGAENLSTTGTLASGALTVTGALSSTTTVSSVTGDFEVIEAGDASLGVNGLDAAQGGAILITGGISSTAGNAGGAVDLVGGTPGSTGAGGAVAVTGAIGGSTSGAGGAVAVTGGAGTAGDANGGAVTIEGGLQNGSGAAGVLNLGTTNTDVINLGHAATTLNFLGTRTNTAQPAFLVFHSVDDTNVTGNGTTATIDFDTEVFDQGADFASDTFTAPVTGRYALQAQVQAFGLTPAADSLIFQISTSNRNYQFQIVNADDLDSTIALKLQPLTDMDASDTATVTLVVNGEASDVVDIDGNVSDVTTFFSGYLLT